MKRRSPLALLVVFLFLSLALPGQAAIAPPDPGSTVPAAPEAASAPAAPQANQVVNISFSTEAQLLQLTSRLDVWEVHRDQGYAVAYVSAAERAWLSGLGYQFQVDAIRSNNPDTIPGFPCYRTIAELSQQLDAWAAQYPQLVQLTIIGHSYDGRLLRVARLTNKQTSGPKPVFFLMANIHGRELITPETAMVFIQRLLQGYGTDPDITWMLDNHEAQVLFSINPDGHVMNEPGQPWAYWRKNTHPYGSCTPGGGPGPGVDLNRNSSFKWGYDNEGSSPYQCDEVYRGPSAHSEVETQAFENYVRTIFPDQRGPADTDPAPANATGVFITLHSYANDILWPWGFEPNQPPNSAQLQRFGEKMATFNGYSTGQADGPLMYPTNGTSDDWAYGELGVAAYTFEMGSNNDGFYPSCSRYDAIIQPTIGSLLYALRSARTPYMTSYGPDALSITLTPSSVVAGAPVALHATINDTTNGSQPIAAAEAYIDTPPWAGGTPTALAPVDGAWNQAVEQVQGTLATASLSQGRHLVYVRGKDNQNNWGPVSAAFLQVAWAPDSWIAGTVRSAGTGAPIAGASVVLSDTTKTTGPAGGYAFLVYPGTYTLTAGAPAYYPAVVTGVQANRGMTTTVDITLTPVPTGTLHGFVREAITNLPLAADLRLASGAVTYQAHSDADTGYYEFQPMQGTYTVTVQAGSHSPITQYPVVIPPNGTVQRDFTLAVAPCVLLVDDDASHDYGPYFRTALEEAGILYTPWDVTEKKSLPGVQDLANHRAVLWSTGDVSGRLVLTATSRSRLTTYLQGGGNLLLTGSDVAVWIPNTTFYRDVLATSFDSDDSEVQALAGGPPFGSQPLQLNGGDGANDQNFPDAISPRPGAFRVFTYTNGLGGGVAFDAGTYRSINLGFGIEGLSTAAARRTVVRDGLSWLGCEPVPVDLHLGLAADASLVKPGDLLTYTLSMGNNSLIPISGLVITDVLPAEVDFVSGPPGAILDGRTVRLENVTLPPGGAAALALVTRVHADAPGGAIIHNADYGAQAYQMREPVLGAQAADTLVEVVPGVEITPPEAGRFCPVGHSITHVVHVTNRGNAADTFAVSLAQGAWLATVPDTAVGPLAAGATADLLVTVNVPLLTPFGATDTVTITVTSNSSALASASAVLTTEAVAGSQVYLPILVR